ncbi:hypothetical protein GCK32_014034 [Trichostrongylus colubriformis]|uniref:Uncharacterized protein n=1 Tax=Trichostrongylus colubriformis TaxID=6319 RepID=A0AAN8F0N6_TRICO
MTNRIWLIQMLSTVTSLVVSLITFLSLGHSSIGLQCIRTIPDQNEVQTTSCDGLCMRQVVLVNVDEVKDGLSQTTMVAIARDCTHSKSVHAGNCTDSKSATGKSFPEPRVITCFCGEDFCNF